MTKNCNYQSCLRPLYSSTAVEKAIRDLFRTSLRFTAAARPRRTELYRMRTSRRVLCGFFSLLNDVLYILAVTIYRTILCIFFVSFILSLRFETAVIPSTVMTREWFIIYLGITANRRMKYR